MKKILNKTLLLLFSLVIVTMMILFVVSKKESFSEEENRYLTSFSINEISDYVNDHFPFRNTLISLKNKFEYTIGKRYINNIYLASDNYLLPAFNTNEKKAYIVEKINAYNSKVGNVDVMIVPDSIYINQDKMPYHPPVIQDEEFDYLYSSLKTNNIDLRETLLAHKDKDLYYKTDHHWTSFGAYLGYQEYMKVLDKPCLSYDDFMMYKASDSFLGTSSSAVIGLAKEEDIYLSDKKHNLTVEYVNEGIITDSIYELDYLNQKDKYALFLDNNHALIKITNNDLDDNSSILIVKNSYANCFSQFIIDSYQYVYFIDLRYYSDAVSDFVLNNNIERTLILYNLNNLYSDLSIVRLK